MKQDRALQGKIYNLQAIRGVAVLLVMAFHAYIMDQLYQDGTLLPGWFNFGAVGVDIFFVLSGFIMVFISHERAGDASYVPAFIVNRIVRIVPLYWLISGMVFVFALYYPGMVNTSAGNRIDPVASFLFLPSEVLPLIPVGWTLVFEVHFYLLFAMTLFLPRQSMPFVILGTAAVVLALNLSLDPDARSLPPYLLLVSSPFILEFLAGWALGLWMVTQRPEKGGGAALGAALALFVVGAAVLEQRAPGEEYHVWPRVLAFLVPSVLLVYGATVLDQTGSRIAGRVWVFLGDASYSLYLTHILVMHFVGRFIWPRLDPWLGDGSALLMAVFNIGAALVAGIVCFWIIERPMQRRLGGLVRNLRAARARTPAA